MSLIGCGGGGNLKMDKLDEFIFISILTITLYYIYNINSSNLSNYPPNKGEVRRKFKDG